MEINIKPDREHIYEICSKIDTGVYAIPVFQRDYIWSKDQILDLFDSISKGFPIGTVMLWQPQDGLKNSKMILTDETVENPAPQYYILDGRQRLTSFYGCVSQVEDKDDRFKLSYNLVSGRFEYTDKNSDTILRVSDIYDTFSLLGRLQTIIEKVLDKEKAKEYINRAKKLNAIFQSYDMGEMVVNNCPLSEARVIFSRINSKGTDISNVHMLQALSYRKENDLLLSNEIDGILENLIPYGFNGLSQDDILNCFYRWYKKKFYDAKIDDLENVDFTVHLAEIKEVILKSVRFLFEECSVLSNKILPYSKQLIAITWFFKAFPEPTQEQKAELKKWFFYTTCQQSFQNSSLSNIRNIFNKFDDYLSEKSSSLIDYKPIKWPLTLCSYLSVNSAKKDFMLIAMADHYKKSYHGHLRYNSYLRKTSNDPEGCILMIDEDDYARLESVFSLGIITEDISRYLLDETMVNCYRSKDFISFKQLRKNAILECEKKLIAQHGIAIEGIN